MRYLVQMPKRPISGIWAPLEWPRGVQKQSKSIDPCVGVYCDTKLLQSLSFFFFFMMNEEIAIWS